MEYTLLVSALLCLCVVDYACASKADHSENYSDQVRLYNDLLNSAKFNKHVRPVNHTDEVVEIKMELDLVALIELNEKDQTMSTSLWLKFLWKDHFLRWDPKDYGNITMFLVPQRYIWVPDITMGNSIQPNIHLGYEMNLDEMESDHRSDEDDEEEDDYDSKDKQTLVRLYWHGWVEWEPSVLIQTDCDIIVSYYPFDSQACEVEFVTQRTTAKEVDIQIVDDFLHYITPEVGDYPHKNRSILKKYNEDGTWRMAGYSYHRDIDEEDREHVVFNFLFERRNTFFVVNIIMPVIFLSLTASLVFALPDEAGEKMGTSITVLLAYAVYLTIVSDFLPDTSLDISLLALYLTLLLGLTAFSVVVTVFILRLYAKGKDEENPKIAGDCLSRITKFLQWITCYRNPIKYNRPGSDDGRQGYSDNVSYTVVAKTLDWFCFITFSLATMATTIIFMLLLVVGSKINRPELPEAPPHLN